MMSSFGIYKNTRSVVLEFSVLPSGQSILSEVSKLLKNPLVPCFRL